MKKATLKKMVIIGVAGLMFLVIPEAVFAAGSPGVTQYPQLKKILDFITFIVNVIRYLVGGFAGLVATQQAWVILTSSNGLDTAKKNLKQAVIAIVVVFAGTGVANFFVDQAAKILL